MKKTILLMILSLLLIGFIDAQDCLPEGISFKNQTEVDIFPLIYPGCTHIEGQVRLDNTAINNLDGLDAIVYIGGSLIILNNDSLVSLDGLSNVTMIGGGIQLAGNESLINLSGLNSLESIGGGLRIYQNQLLTDLDDLSSLEYMSGFLMIRLNPALVSISGLNNLGGDIYDVIINNNASLSNCEAQFLCDYLLDPGGTVQIYNNAPGCNSPSEIADYCTISLPCLAFGNYYFFQQADIDNFQSDYPGCTTLTGYTFIKGPDIVNLDGLGVITAISGNLIIDSCSNLSDLTGLGNTSELTGQLSISNCPSLTSLGGLEGLDWIPGGLSISNTGLSSLEALSNVRKLNRHLALTHNPSLESLTGLDSISSITGGYADVIIFDNPALTSLQGLNSMTYIEGSLQIGGDGSSGNNALESLGGLENLAHVGGSLEIYNNESLASIQALANLDSIDYDLRINSNNSLADLTGLDNLEYLGHDIFISSNESLSDLNGMQGLDSIGGMLSLSHCTTLTDLSALEGLTEIGGSLTINFNPVLSSLSGLDNINPSSISDIYITNNTILTECEISSVCEYLINPTGTIIIHDNAENCNSQEEVENACETISIPEEIPGLQCKVFPNPSSGLFNFNFTLTSRQRVTLKVYDYQGKETATLCNDNLPPDDYQFLWDPIKAADGIYFYRLFTNAGISAKGKLLLIH